MRYTDFEQILLDDLTWRKREISELLLTAKELNREILLKSTILLLYAHWEGYIKKSSKAYIRYVSEKRIKIKDLTDNFQAVFIKAYISRCIDQQETLTLANELAFMNKYLKNIDKPFHVDIDHEDDFAKDIINTESNLKPKVFKNIISILGMHYKAAISAREHYLNSHLIASRNSIGHGSKFESLMHTDFELTINDVERLKDFILTIIDRFKDCLLEYSDKEFFLHVNSSLRISFEDAEEALIERDFKAIEEKYSI
jgi:ABC-type sugar transport system ATPase subunit